MIFHGRDSILTAVIRIILLVALLSPQLVTAVELSGKVVSIADGDTLTLLVAGREQVKIRLAEIDTPEKGQPYGRKARKALAELAFQKDAHIVWSEKDRYGRVIGRVYIDDLDVNAEMVHLGHAWVYREYSEDEFLLALEKEARAARSGLWALSEAEKVPPWEWRKVGRQKLQPASESKGEAFTCGSKRYCKEMESCEEARFYLTKCGLNRLDGDKDGAPCESLCR